MTALAASGISKAVRLPSGQQLTLLHAVDLAVEPGESLALVGRSGSGKTTLLSILGLLLRPDTGEIRIGGHNPASLNDRGLARLRNLHIGFVFQNYSLIRHFTVAQNVETPLLQGPPLRRQEIRRRVHQALERVGLADRASSYPRHLSGGEQQRVAIARSLVRRPDVILADEPTGSLDSDTAGTVLAALQDASTGAAVVIVTHDDAVARSAQRRLVLHGGALQPPGAADAPAP